MSTKEEPKATNETTNATTDPAKTNLTIKNKVAPYIPDHRRRLPAERRKAEQLAFQAKLIKYKLPSDAEGNLIIKSCLRANGGTPYTQRGHHPRYVTDPETYETDRENEISEWKAGYTPIILPQQLRNHRRCKSLNPHFWKAKKSKSYAKLLYYVRLGMVELSTQSGLGARYRFCPPPKKSYDHAMKCVSRIIYGSTCCYKKLRLQARREILDNWDKYKWEVTEDYAIHMELFRNFDPNDPRPEIQERARCEYGMVSYDMIHASKRIDIAVACEVHNINFYLLEICSGLHFKVTVRTKHFPKSVYFIAKDIPYSGIMIDRPALLQKNLLLVWLNPVTRFAWNLQLNRGWMRLTYLNDDIGFFHLFEEDPRDPVAQFNITNDYKLPRHHVIRFHSIVYVLHYYGRLSHNVWDGFMRCIGCWEPREVDERIIRCKNYTSEQFFIWEKVMHQAADYGTYRTKINQKRKTAIQAEEYLADMKSTECFPYRLKRYIGTTLRNRYLAIKKRTKLKGRGRIFKARQLAEEMKIDVETRVQPVEKVYPLVLPRLRATPPPRRIKSTKGIPIFKSKKENQ